MRRSVIVLLILVALGPLSGAYASTVTSPTGTASSSDLSIAVTLDLSQDSETDELNFEALTFDVQCSNQVEAQGVTIPAADLADGFDQRFLAQHPVRGACSVELLDLPAGWEIVTPLLNPITAVGAGTRVEFELRRIPLTRNASLRIDVQMQAPADFTFDDADELRVTYRCADGLTDTLNVGVDQFALLEGSASAGQGHVVLRREIVVEPGQVCGAEWIGMLDGLYVSEGYAVQTAANEVVTINFTARLAPGETFTCKGRDATIVGTAGADTIVGTTGPDVIYADRGHDIVRSGGGADLVCGGLGNDQLWGNAGKDRLLGGPGNDILRGGRGRDSLVGGAGNDVADGAKHDDTCTAEFERRCEAAQD